MLNYVKRSIAGAPRKRLILIASIAFQSLIMAPSGNAGAAEFTKKPGMARHDVTSKAIKSPQKIIDSLASALSGGDVEAATALFDAKAVVTLRGGRTYSGIDQIRNLWQSSAEQFPAHVEFSALRASGGHLRFTATIVATDMTSKAQISATMHDGKIHTYTVEADNGAATPTTMELRTPSVGTVLSMHRQSTAVPALKQAGSAGTRTTTGKPAPAADTAPFLARPDAPAPQFAMTIKLQDGRVLSVTQEEAFDVGAQVRVVSVADKTRALAMNANETVAIKDGNADLAKNGWHAQASGAGAQTTMSLAPPGVFFASWNQYQGFPTRLMSASDGICFLQGVTGNFRGGGEGVWVRNNGGFWELNGMSRQQNVSARAMCVPFSAIQGANQGFSYLIGTASASAYYRGCSWWETCHSASAFQDLFGLDSFCYLTGMGGAFNGGGEIVSANAWAPDHWYIMVNTQVQGASIIGEAGCIAAIGHPRLRTTNVVYRTSWSQGQPPVQLPNADQAFCALDWITGHFAGWGESIDISHNPDNTQWLAGTSQQQGVMANASCMYYDQRQ